MDGYISIGLATFWKRWDGFVSGLSMFIPHLSRVFPSFRCISDGFPSDKSPRSAPGAKTPWKPPSPPRPWPWPCRPSPLHPLSSRRRPRGIPPHGDIVQLDPCSSPCHWPRCRSIEPEFLNDFSNAQHR